MAVPDPESSSGSEEILILAPIGRDGAAAAALLREAGLTSTVCAGLQELRDALDAGAGMALVAEEALYRAPIEPIVEWVDQQPPWSDFPFVMLTSSRGSSSDDVSRIRLLDALRNVSLLERPVHTVTLISVVRAALRARQRQYEIRHHLRVREQAASDLEALVAERTKELEAANRRLRAEIAEREQAEAALRQAQKMEAIGQLTGGVAHDFNNLLTAVLGNLDLATRTSKDEKVLRLLTNAECAARRGAKLTQQLLAFSRKQHLKPEAVDLNALVSGMGDLLLRTIGATVRVKTVLEKNLWPAMVDAGQIELVILNLAINGRDAMEAGGHLTVTTENIGAADPRRPSELSPGDYVAVSITDTGTGMTEEVLAKAYEPFFTTKDTGHGTGLGLSQVYGVARQSGGTVRIDSRLGQGTTVTVFLPRATVAAKRSPEPPTRSDGNHQGRAILVVDDDPDVREIAVEGLESLGYAVTAAASGRAALAILERGTPVDLMVIDYAMPELNGVETVRLARAKRQDVRILFMTGYADTAALVGQAGSRDRVLKKPFTLPVLCAAIEDAMGGTGSANTISR